MAPTTSDSECSLLGSAASSSDCEREECKLIKSELCRLRSELKGRIRSFRYLINVNSQLATVDNLMQQITELVENVGWFVSYNNNNDPNKSKDPMVVTRAKEKNKPRISSPVPQHKNKKNVTYQTTTPTHMNNNNLADQQVAAENEQEEQEEMDHEIICIPETQLPPLATTNTNRNINRNLAIEFQNLQFNNNTNNNNNMNTTVPFDNLNNDYDFNNNNNNENEHDNINNVTTTSTTTDNTKKRKLNPQHEQMADVSIQTEDEHQQQPTHNESFMQQHLNQSIIPQTKRRTMTMKYQLSKPFSKKIPVRVCRSVVECPAAEFFENSSSLSLTPVSVISGTPSQEGEPPHGIFASHKILKSIFSFLTPTDINSCSLVNKTWNSVSSIMNKQKYWIIRLTDLENEYKLRLRRRALSLGDREPVDEIEKEAKDHQNLLTSFKQRVAIQNKKLREDPSCKTILIISQLPDSRCQEIQEIFSIIKNNVTHLYFGTWACWGIIILEENPFFSLLSSLPNVHTLRFFSHGLYWHDITSRFRGYAQRNKEPAIKFPKLKTMFFPEDLTEFPYVFLLHLLKACPHLSVIYNFPLQEAHALKMTMKGSLVRSIGHSKPLISREDHYHNYQNMCTWARETRGIHKMSISVLDSSQVKYGEPWDSMIEQALDLFQWSLRKLEIHPLEGINYLSFHQTFGNVEHLKFSCISSNYESQSRNKRFFHPKLDLNEVFPHVEHVTMDLDCVEAEWVDEYFPLDQFIPGQVFMTVSKLSMNRRIREAMVKRMKRIFPKITHLEIRTESDCLRKWFYCIPRLWPKLETLTIIVNYFRNNKDWDNILGQRVKPPPDNTEFILDPVITGYSKEKCAELRNQSNWGRETTPFCMDELEVNKYSYRYMSDLRLIKIIFNNQDHADDFPLLLSPLSFLHGLNLCPQLLVFIGVAHDCPRHKDRIISSLKPLLPHVEFDPSYFDYERL